MNDEQTKVIVRAVSILALKGFKIKLLEAAIIGDIIPEHILNMIDQEIKSYGE